MPPIPLKFIREFVNEHDFIGYSQRIRKLQITPQPNAMLFQYSTNQPTVTIIEIFRLAQTTGGTILFLPENLVTVKFNFLGAYITEHKGRIDGLAQDTSFSFRITAGNGALKAAVAVGSFKTGKRSAAFVVRDIMVFNDSDSWPDGDGEMAFAYGFYNENDDRISQPDNHYYTNGIASGELIGLPFGKAPTFATSNAPDWMAVYVGGYEDDSFWRRFHKWVSAPAKLPESATHYENGDGVGADAFQQLRLPDPPGSHRVGFTLNSGPWGIHYITTGWADVVVTPPFTLPNIPKSAMMGKTIWTPRPWATLHSAGQQVKIEHPGGRHSVIALGPQGMLALRQPAERRSRSYNWKMIEAGGVDAAALVATREGIVLFALSGGVVRRRVAALEESEAATQWHTLGEGFRPPLSAVTLREDSIALTVLGQDGHLYGMLMQPDQSEGRWIDLGGDFAGSVVVLPEKRSLDIFGLTPEGRVLTAEWQPQSQEEVAWQALEGEPLAFLYAGKENGSTHLIGLTADRQVLALSREDSYWDARWTPLGTLDDVDMEDIDTPAEVA